MKKGGTAKIRKKDTGSKNATFRLSRSDHELMTHCAQLRSISPRQLFVDMLTERHRPAFPMLLVLSRALAAAHALKTSGVSDERLSDLRCEVDRLADLALCELRTTPATDL